MAAQHAQHMAHMKQHAKQMQNIMAAASGKYTGEGFNNLWHKKFRANLYVGIHGSSIKVWVVPPDAFQGFMRFEMNGSYDQTTYVAKVTRGTPLSTLPCTLTSPWRCRVAQVSGGGASYTMKFSGGGGSWRVHCDWKSLAHGWGTVDAMFSGDTRTTPGLF